MQRKYIIQNQLNCTKTIRKDCVRSLMNLTTKPTFLLRFCFYIFDNVDNNKATGIDKISPCNQVITNQHTYVIQYPRACISMKLTEGNIPNIPYITEDFVFTFLTILIIIKQQESIKSVPVIR